jgi:hypothetical protein
LIRRAIPTQPPSSDAVWSLASPADDPNAALWASLRPAPVPRWHVQLGARARAVVVTLLRRVGVGNLPVWIASRTTARGWLMVSAAGFALGVLLGSLGRVAHDGTVQLETVQLQAVQRHAAQREAPTRLAGSVRTAAFARSGEAPRPLLLAAVGPASPANDAADGEGTEPALVVASPPSVKPIVPGRSTKRHGARPHSRRAAARGSLTGAGRPEPASLARILARSEPSQRSRRSARRSAARAAHGRDPSGRSPR